MSQSDDKPEEVVTQPEEVVSQKLDQFEVYTAASRIAGEAMDSENPTEIYRKLVAQAEYGAIEKVLRHEKVRHNQTAAAKYLGINRGTLRKKMALFGMMDAEEMPAE